MRDLLEAGAALAAIVAAIVAWLKANDAKIAERRARDQAEAAIQAAERTASALEGMQSNSSAAAADLKAEREAQAVVLQRGEHARCSVHGRDAGAFVCGQRPRALGCAINSFANGRVSNSFWRHGPLAAEHAANDGRLCFAGIFDHP